MKDFSLGAMYWQNPNYGQAEVEEDMRRIRDNNFNMIRTFIWWEQVEPREGQRDFTLHDILFAAAAKYGIKVMATFGFYLPPWLQAQLVARGIEDKGRYACFDRPEVAEPLRDYIETVVHRYKDEPALAIWNLWNEPTKAPCKCEHTLNKFVIWLKERYGDIENLKKAWLGEHQVFTTFYPDSFDTLNVQWVQYAFEFASRGRATPMEYDFLEFSTVNLDDNLRWLRDITKGIDPIHATHANPNSPVRNGLQSGTDEWKLAKTLDSVSVSIHPSHFFFKIETPENFPITYSYSVDEIRSQAAGKDAWVGELQAGTTYHHLFKYTATANDISHYLWQAIGRGLKGVLFWEWQSWRSSMMEVGAFSLRRCYDGGPTERSAAAAAVGAVLQNHAAIFDQAERPASQVAILVSRATKIYKLAQKRSKSNIENLENEHNFACYGCYKALHRANLAVDFVDEDQIMDGALAKYKALFMPCVEVMGPAVADKIKEFANRGGWVWADGRCAFLDERVYIRHMIPGHGLDEMFGCREADFIATRGQDPIKQPGDKALQTYRHAQYLEPTTGKVLGTYLERPIVVRNSYGRGVAELNGSHLTLGLQKNADAATMDYLARFAFDAGARPILEISPAIGFEACLLTCSASDIMIITNHAGPGAEAVIKTPHPYKNITDTNGYQKHAVLEGATIRRVFDDFETVALLCEKA